MSLFLETLRLRAADAATLVTSMLVVSFALLVSGCTPLSGSAIQRVEGSSSSGWSCFRVRTSSGSIPICEPQNVCETRRETASLDAVSGCEPIAQRVHGATPRPICMSFRRADSASTEAVDYLCTLNASSCQMLRSEVQSTDSVRQLSACCAYLGKGTVGQCLYRQTSRVPS